MTVDVPVLTGSVESDGIAGGEITILGAAGGDSVLDSAVVAGWMAFTSCGVDGTAATGPGSCFFGSDVVAGVREEAAVLFLAVDRPGAFDPRDVDFAPEPVPAAGRVAAAPPATGGEAVPGAIGGISFALFSFESMESVLAPGDLVGSAAGVIRGASFVLPEADSAPEGF